MIASDLMTMDICVYIVSSLLMVLYQGTQVCGSQSWNSPDATTQTAMPPTFQDTPDFIKVRQGQMARLQCSVNNLETLSLTWRRISDSNPLTIGRRRFVNDERISVENALFSPDWSLIIKQVRLDDEGQYECQVSSVNRQLRKVVYLKVMKGPLVNPVQTWGHKSDAGITMTGKTFVDKDEQLRLMCNATGGESLPDEIDWFFKGEKLSTDDAKGISIVKQVNLMDRTIHSVLKIKSAKMTDAGSYVCRTSDLQVNSAQVEVLNAETKNIKRGITNSSQDKYDIPKSRHDRLDNPGSENGGNVSRPSSGQHITVLIIFLICLVTLLTDGYRTTLIVT